MIEEVLKRGKSKKRSQTGISSQTHPGGFPLGVFFWGGGIVGVSIHA
jgi:hypothetical protein